MQRTISFRSSEHRGGLQVAMFEFGLSEDGIVGSDLMHKHLTESQNSTDLGPIGNVVGSLTFQLLKAVLYAFQSVVGLRAHQTQSLAAPRRDRCVHLEEFGQAWRRDRRASRDAGRDA